MKNCLIIIFCVYLLSILSGCGNSDSSIVKPSKLTAKGEYIYRVHDEHRFLPAPPEKKVIPPYAWEKGLVGNHPKITKEYFRCKGSSLNPPKVVQGTKETERFYDCGGSEKHSLPLRKEKEFIYPILIDLLNYAQSKTGKRVIITSGHRCPDHNTYCDPSKGNQYSKHMIGAEVSFYVQGLENSPEKVIQTLQNYFKDSGKYQGKEFLEFKRWEKKDVDVMSPPWYNKEVFIKLYRKNEGRNFDNRHPYPYISIQVRFDAETKEKVIYTWDKAFHNYLRW